MTQSQIIPLCHTNRSPHMQRHVLATCFDLECPRHWLFSCRRPVLALCNGDIAQQTVGSPCLQADVLELQDRASNKRFLPHPSPHRVEQTFGHICKYATSQKVAGSIQDVIEFPNWPDPSSRTMARESTQPVTEMSTRNLRGGGGGKVRLTTSPPSVSLDVWQPYGSLQPLTGIALRDFRNSYFYSLANAPIWLWTFQIATFHFDAQENKRYTKKLWTVCPQGQGQGYITTNSQSVSVSWYRAQFRTIHQSLLSPWNFI
jgi:hypothetical protein